MMSFEDVAEFATRTVEGAVVDISTQIRAEYNRAVDFLRTRQSAYRLAFRQPAGQMVLQDLAKFCRAGQTTFDLDPRVHALWEGRKEVWLRITQHLHMSEAELYELLK